MQFPRSVHGVLIQLSCLTRNQAFGLIVRRINDEPFDVPSVPGSRAVTIKFMIPNSRMGSVIGKQGSKIKEIQDASGARLNASEGMLPGSTEVRLMDSLAAALVTHRFYSEFLVWQASQTPFTLQHTILEIFLSKLKSECHPQQIRLTVLRVTPVDPHKVDHLMSQDMHQTPIHLPTIHLHNSCKRNKSIFRMISLGVSLEREAAR